jgi:hypothetical protein
MGRELQLYIVVPEETKIWVVSLGFCQSTYSIQIF